MSEESNIRRRLDEAEATLDALRREEVDAVVGGRNVMLMRLREVEQALRDSEERLRLSMNASRMYAWTWDFETDMIERSEIGPSILGIPASPRPSEERWRAMHPEDVPSVRAAVRRAIDDKGRLAIDCRFIRPDDGRLVWAHLRGTVDYDEDGRPKRMIGTTTDISDRKQAELERDRFFDLSTDILAIASTDAPGWKRINPAFSRILGWSTSELLEMSIMDLVHPDDEAATRQGLERIAGGAPGVDFEHRLRTKDGRYRWIAWRSVPYLAENLVYCVGRDITVRREREERMQTVLSELNHRVKNTLAVIQSIAAQAIRRAPDLETFSGRFMERLQSIAAAHSLLTRSEWEGANLHEIIANETEARVATAGQLSIEGPGVRLHPKIALAMHMVVHELATNACKYGALQSTEGRIDVSWSIGNSGASQLFFEWRERCRDPIEEPDEGGYGSRLIEQLIEYDLAGEVEREFQRYGLVYRIEFPLAVNGMDAPERDRGSVARIDPKIPHVLLVEDNAMLAMAVREELEAAGFSVLGPARSLGTAIRLAEDHRPRAAVLDVDLGGVRVYPLARDLRDQGVPFALLTGYDRATLPPDLQEMTVFNKPVEPPRLIAFLEQHCERRADVLAASTMRPEAPDAAEGANQDEPAEGPSSSADEAGDEARSPLSDDVEPAPAGDANAEPPPLRILRHDIRNSIATMKLVLQSSKLKQEAGESSLVAGLDEEIRTMQAQFETLVEHYTAEQPGRDRDDHRE